jgi:hypothetical protein
LVLAMARKSNWVVMKDDSWVIAAARGFTGFRVPDSRILWWFGIGMVSPPRGDGRRTVILSTILIIYRICVVHFVQPL